MTIQTNDRESWLNAVEATTRDLASSIASGKTFILVDDQQLGNLDLGRRRPISFLERGGLYFGAPADDETAIAELTRLRQIDPVCLAFTWPCFWWLESYPRFAQYLRSSFPCVLENERVIVFDLQKPFHERSPSGPDSADRRTGTKATPLGKHYQPVYTTMNPLGDVLLEGERKCIDRAEMILRDLSAIGITSGSLLDIGCNIGFFCHYFQSRGYSCTGYEDNSHVDIMQFTEKNSLETAEELSAHYGVYPKFTGASALTLLQADHKFDVILCLSVAHHWFVGYGHSDKDKMGDEVIEKILQSFCAMANKAIYFEFGDFGGWAQSDVPRHLERLTGITPVRIGVSDGYEADRVVWRLLRL
jgi:SAM-dependent methyltransferase